MKKLLLDKLIEIKEECGDLSAWGDGFREALEDIINEVESMANPKFHIMSEILEERERQDTKWGVQNHNPVEWCAIIGEEVGETNKEALEFYFDYGDKQGSLKRYRSELVQVAAVALAMIESVDRNELKK